MNSFGALFISKRQGSFGTGEKKYRMNLWKHLALTRRKLSITTKFNLAFITLLLLMVIVALSGLFSMNNVSRQMKRAILTSTEVKRLVFKMDAELSKATRIERQFFLNWLATSVSIDAINNYRQKHRDQVEQVFVVGDELQKLIQDASISNEVGQSYLDYVEMVENYSHSFNETVGKVSQLGIDDVGELAKLKDSAQMLKERLELADEPDLMLTYLEMQSSEKEYISTRQPDKMQSMTEASQRLRDLILISSKLDATQRSEILRYLDKYKSAVTEIVKFDQEIQDQLNDFDQKSNQVSQQLIALIDSEVEQADYTIDLVIQAAKILLLVALVVAVLAAGTVAKQFASALKRLAREKKNSERLLLNILPKSIAERLKQEEGKIADSFTAVTVLFADIVGFTELAAQISPEELVGILNVIFSEFDELTEKHGLEKIKTIGDAYMVVGGLPEEKPDHAAAIAAMAIDMQRVIKQFSQETGNALSIRIGINTGPVVAGIIGRKKFVYDLWGDTVNIASRMESHGIPGGIQVSETTHNYLKNQYLFQDRGSVQVKGKGQMNCYLLKEKQRFLEAD